MTLNLVELGYEYFPDPARGRPVFNGSIYVGEPDTDPTLPINQKEVTLRYEGGDIVVAQPVTTGAGGVPLYNGSPAQILTDGNYSLAVLDSKGVQVYYVPDFYSGRPLMTSTGISKVDNVAEMVATSFAPNDCVQTRGYYSPGDGGGSKYLVTDTYPEVPDELGEAFTLDNGNVAVLQETGFVSFKLWGALADGITDDSASISAAINSSFKQFITKETENYYIPSRLTFSNVDDLIIKGQAIISTIDIDGVFLFDDCDDLKLMDLNFQGNQDRASWEALTPAERQEHRPLITVENSTRPRFINLKGRMKSELLKIDLCTDSYIESMVHIGCYGFYVEGRATDPNFGYACFIRGGSNHSLINPVAAQCSGAVLIGLDAEEVTSYGGMGSDTHDNGWYGSSCVGAVCHGFTTRRGYQQCVKMRGSDNIISHCLGYELDAPAYVMSGIPLNSSVDPQGATGSGGGIYFCEARDSFSLLRIDATTEDGPLLYMRNVEAVGCKGFDMNSMVGLPIEAYGVRDVTVKDCIINTFVADEAIFATGPASKGVNFKIEGNHASDGARLIRIIDIDESSIHNNDFKNMSEVIVIRLQTSENNRFTMNRGDDNTKRIDVRSNLGSKCFDNDMFIQGNNNVQGESDSERNDTNPTYDVSTLIPTRVGHIVSNGTNMYIAKATTATSDWVLI